MSEYIAKPTSRKNIRELTNVLRDILDLNDERYFPIMEFLEIGMPTLFEGFYYEIMSAEEMYQYGLTYPKKNKICLREDVYERAISGVGRDRFTVAHEIGHYIMHKPGSISLARTKLREDIPAYKRPEWQANTFAGELLAPPHLIQGLSLKEIALSCGVSMDVARIQLNQI